jgi:hypothetical protein
MGKLNSLGNVNVLFRSIIETRQYESAYMTRSNHLWQIAHKKLLQRFDPIEWTPLLNVLPIYREFEPVTTSPLAHQLPGGARRNISRTKPTVKNKRRLPETRRENEEDYDLRNTFG